MRIWHHSFSHWRWQKRNFYLLNKFPNLIFCSSISSSLANNYQGFLCKSNYINGFSDFKGWWTEIWRLCEDRYFNLSLNHFVKHVTRNVQENRSWSSCCCKSYSFVHMIRDIFSRCYSDTVFCVGFDKIALIDFLEGSSLSLVKIVWPTDQDHWPVIYPRI